MQVAIASRVSTYARSVPDAKKATGPSPFSRALRAARDERGWSQSELAHRSKVPAGHISQIETGERPDPQISTVVKLCTALGVSLDALLPGEMTSERTPAVASAIDLVDARRGGVLVTERGDPPSTPEPTLHDLEVAFLNIAGAIPVIVEFAESAGFPNIAERLRALLQDQRGQP